MKKTITKTAIILLIVLLGNTKVNGQSVYYGSTRVGGTSNFGVLFVWDPVAETYTKKYDLSDWDNGIWPCGSLSEYNGKLYSMTYSGGAYGEGVIFEWDPSTNIYTKKIDFYVGENGWSPTGALVLYGNKFYGMTQVGGINLEGVIFEWDPVTNIYTKKFDFDFIIGAYPLGSLILKDDKFYGLTSDGGTGGGVIFEWDPVTNEYSKKHEFSWNDGYYPDGKLYLYGDKFYGTTSSGGDNETGFIFEWDPTTNLYIGKHEFDEIDSYGPSSFLTLYNDKFYGTTLGGGTLDLGVLYEWDPVTNIYTKKFDFSGSNGWLPSNALNLIGDKLYGMTQVGGTYNKGVLFEWDLETNTYTKKFEFDGINGASPIFTTLHEYFPAAGDIDNDGYTTEEGDCDDNDASVNPGAEEICDNGIDDNCNGEIDEGCCDISVDAGTDVTSYFGMTAMQQVNRSAIVTGGTPPFTYSWIIDRPLICNQESDDGDEEFYGGTCTDNTCPESGNPSVNPICFGSASITAVLMDTADICVTVTDANGCSATDCFTVNASDVRCFAGNGNVKVKVCHHTNSQNHPWVEICIDTNALDAHLAHGDFIGPCDVFKMKEFDEVENQVTDLKIFPNPTKESVYLEFNSLSEGKYVIEIVDLTGRKIASFQGITVSGKNETSINTMNMEPGIYLVKLLIDGRQEMKKLLRE